MGQTVVLLGQGSVDEVGCRCRRIVSPSVMGIDTPTTAASARHLIQHAAIFPLKNPGIVSIPLGFLAAGAAVGVGAAVGRVDEHHAALRRGERVARIAHGEAAAH